MAKQSATRKCKSRDDLVRVVAEAFDSVENSGNVVTQCVTGAFDLYGGTEIPRTDVAYMLTEIAKKRGWSEQAAKVRKSECRVVLTQYNGLRAAIPEAQKKLDAFTWRDALKLARLLKKHKGNQREALKELSASKAPAKKTAKSEKGRAIAALNLLMSLKFQSRQFKDDVKNLAKTHGYAINALRKAA